MLVQIVKPHKIIKNIYTIKPQPFAPSWSICLIRLLIEQTYKIRATKRVVGENSRDYESICIGGSWGVHGFGILGPNVFLKFKKVWYLVNLFVRMIPYETGSRDVARAHWRRFFCWRKRNKGFAICFSFSLLSLRSRVSPPPRRFFVRRRRRSFSPSNRRWTIFSTSSGENRVD